MQKVLLQTVIKTDKNQNCSMYSIVTGVCGGAGGGARRNQRENVNMSAAV